MQNPFFNDGSGRNLGDIKLINRAVIFRTIREAGAISRSELAKVSGLNPATVTHIARELTSLGLIEEAGITESKGGRPSTLLKIRSQAGYIIAVHLDRYFMRAMITDLNLEERIYSEIYATQTDKTNQINIENLIKIIDELIQNKKDILQEYVDQNGEKYGKQILNRYEKYLSLLDSDKSVKKGLEIDIIVMLLNMSDVIGSDEWSCKLLNDLESSTDD
jgi:predicted ArsR family transcriptional regulator